MTIHPKVKINNQITAPQVRLIDENSEQLGIVDIIAALNLAKGRGLDLVEIAANGVPPVCKLMDYGKYVFNERKKEKEAKKAQMAARINLKEIRIKPAIQSADLDVKIKNIKRILDEGDKVRVVVRFAGRQVKHTELGKNIFENIIAAIPDAIVESQPIFEGRDLFLILNRSYK